MPSSTEGWNPDWLVAGAGEAHLEPAASYIADFRGGLTCLIDTQLCGCTRASCRPFPVSVGHALSHHGHASRTERPLNHGTGGVGFVSPASFNRGL